MENSSSKSSRCKDKNRPKNTALYQQRLPTHSISGVTSQKKAILMAITGIAFTIAGYQLGDDIMKIVEHSVLYDNGIDGPCHFDATNLSSNSTSKVCSLHFELDEHVDEDFYVYYRLTNFYQNHQRYVQSISYPQLMGQTVTDNDLKLNCYPLYKYSADVSLNPCGLIANSFFNDVIIPINGLTMDESGISLESDSTMFQQPEGFKSYLFSNASITSPASGLLYCQATFGQDYQFYLHGTNLYCFFYPDDSTTHYLYESYPGQISPIEGVTNEHFIVWMRLEILPSFRKLYGKLSGPFNKGDVLSFNITNNFDVGAFNGTKELLISTLGSISGINLYPALVMKVTGILAIVLAAMCLIMT